MSVVRLRHVTRTGDWMMYFYDGELPVEGSVLTIPADKPEWIQRAWIQGFRMTADGRVIADLAKHIRAETADQQPVPCDHEEVMVNEDEVVCCARCGEPLPDLTPADLDNDEEPTPVEEKTDVSQRDAAGEESEVLVGPGEVQEGVEGEGASPEGERDAGAEGTEAPEEA